MRIITTFVISVVILVSAGWAATSSTEDQVNSTVYHQRETNGQLTTWAETIPVDEPSAATSSKPIEPSGNYLDEIDQLTGILLWQTGDTYGMCNDCAVSPDGYYMALGITLNNQRAECYNAASPNPLWQYSVGDVGTKVAVSQNCEVYVLGYGQYVSIFNSSSGSPIWTYDCGAGTWVYQVAVRRDGSLFAAAFIEGETGHVLVFDPASSIPLWETNMPITTGFPFYGLRFNANGTHISANEKFHGWILDAANGDIIWDSAIDNTESPIPMSADASIMAIGLNAGGHCYVYQWNEVTQTYDQLWVYTFTGGYSRWCNEVEVSADGNTIAAGSLEFIYGGEYDGHAAVFDTWENGVPLWTSDTFGDLVGEIAMSDDGQVIAIGSWGDMDNTLTDLRLYERYSSYPFYTLNHPGSINSVDITPDGSMVFAGGKHVHNRIGGNGGDAYCIRIETDYPLVDIDLIPHNPPIQIPASGGSFDFTVEVINTEDDPVNLDVWITTVTPTGYEIELLGPASVLLPGGQSISRDRTQNVPEQAPPGVYLYSGFVGMYPSVYWEDDSFYFEKLEEDVGSGTIIADWWNGGDPFEDSESEAVLPQNQGLIFCYPNPFNPATVISYQLSVISQVNLSIYDISGRKVAELINGWRNAGMHETTFDASNLSSGLYVYCLTAGSITATGKIVLIK